MNLQPGCPLVVAPRFFLSIDWPEVAPAVIALCEKVEKLYRDGIDRPKTAHWIAAYELVAEYVTPHPASTWNWLHVAA